MYRSIATMLFLLIMISSAPVRSQEQQAWVGHQFHPEQCVKIEPGKFPDYSYIRTYYVIDYQG